MDPLLIVGLVIAGAALLRRQTAGNGSASSSSGPPATVPTLPFFDTGQPGRGGTTAVPAGATPGNSPAAPGPSQPTTATPGQLVLRTPDGWTVNVDTSHVFHRAVGGNFVRTTVTDVERYIAQGVPVRDTSLNRWLYRTPGDRPQLRIGTPPGSSDGGIMFDLGGLTPGSL